MTITLMSDLDLSGSRVLIREDLNVPIKNNLVSSDARIRAALPTISQALNAGAQVIIMSHLGRPDEGTFNPQYSLAPVAKYLSDLLNEEVILSNDFKQNDNFGKHRLIMLENVRFNVGEKENSQSLAKAYADLCDIFVMDAFGTAHRAHASTYGVAEYASVSCAGPLLAKELLALDTALSSPMTPIAAIVGGSKVSTKLMVLESFATKVDQLVVGGGIANTFLAAAGKSVGKSLYEPDLVPDAKLLMEKVNIPLPTDVVVGKEFSEITRAVIKSVDDVADDDMILDIGPKSASRLAAMLEQMRTIIWNGPVGVFEFDQFSNGTKVLAEAIADSAAYSIAGGGDTLAAIDRYNIGGKISYISTGGGAFLEFVEGKSLPAVEILEKRHNLER
jgi:phosphoglycerate kinase